MNGNSIPRWMSALFAFALILTVVVAIPQSASAQGNCDQIVSDEAGVFGDRINEVQAEAQKLARYADVRVVTIQTFNPLGTLDAYFEQRKSQCPSWQDGLGGVKSNLIVFMISLEDRKTAIFYAQGGEWNDVLGPNWGRIVSDLMNPRFPEGDFAGGFIAGIREVDRLVNLKINPPTQVPQQPNVIVVPAQQPAGPPPDLSGLWVVLLVLIVGGGGLYALAQAGRSNESRRTARQRVELAKDAANTRLNSWDEDKPHEVAAAMLASVKDAFEPAKLTQYQTALTEANRRAGRAHQSYANLSEGVGTTLNPRLSQAEYVQLAGRYEAILAEVDAALETVEEVRRAVDELKKTAANFPKDVAAAEARIKQAKAAITEGRRGFDEISTQFAEGNWRAVRGNGTEAEKRVTLALDALKAARDAAEKQKWSRAKNLLGQINPWLDEAESLMRSIVSLQTHLAKLRERLPAMLAQEEGDITKTREYILKYDADIQEEFEGELDEAERGLSPIREALAGSRPDYIAIEKVLLAIDKKIDRIAAGARSEREAAERKRQQAADALRRARASVSRAKEYFEDHTGIDNDAKRKRKEATSYLEEAEAARALSEQIRLGELAKETADKAYIMAKSDVDSAHRSSSYDWGSTTSWPSTTPTQRTSRHDTAGGSTGWSPPARHDTGGGSLSWSAPSPHKTAGGSTGW